MARTVRGMEILDDVAATRRQVREEGLEREAHMAVDVAAVVDTQRPASMRGRAELGFAAAALVGVALAWGFAVDDALISGRVAHHLASGLGYRFNPSGPSVDCVTPLGWALLLAPLASTSAWQAVSAASLKSTPEGSR